MDTQVLLILIGLILLMSSCSVYYYYKLHRKEHFQASQELKRSELLLDTLQSNEKERKAIGQDIHNDLSPIFSAILLNIEKVKQITLKDKDKENMLRLLAETNKNVSIALKKFNRVSKQLYPFVLSRYGFKKAVEDCIQTTLEDSEVSIIYQIDHIEINNELYSLSLYRLIEAMVYKSYQSKNLRELHLEIKNIADEIHIRFRDPLFLENAKSSTIYRDIENKTLALGGDFKLNSSADIGIYINITVQHETGSYSKHSG